VSEQEHIDSGERARNRRRVELANERLQHESTAIHLMETGKTCASIAHSLIAANIRALEGRIR